MIRFLDARFPDIYALVGKSKEGVSDWIWALHNYWW